MIIVVEWSGQHRRRPSGFQHTHTEGEVTRPVVEQNISGEAASDECVDE